MGSFTQASIREKVDFSAAEVLFFSSISEEGKNQFFSLRKKRGHGNEYWAYDTTSISSYSEMLKQVAYGKNTIRTKFGELISRLSV